MSYSSSNNIRLDHDSDQPLDTVQCILWDPYDRSCRTFLTGGWDGVARLYQIEGNSSKKLQKKWQYYFHHPIITMDLTSNKFLIVGLSTGQVGLVSLQNSNNALLLGQHDAPVVKVVWIQKFQVVVSFGFDNLIKVFTLKSNNNNNFQIAQYKLPAKTYTVAFSYPYFLIGAQTGQIALINSQKFNDTNFNNQYQNIFDESHGIVKFTASALDASKCKIILGTADGRLISTTYTTSSHSGVRISKPYVGRYQKKSTYRKDTVAQINGIDYGFKDGKYQFAIFCGTQETGVFSLEKNQKIKTYSSTSSAITAVSISPDCQYYAFAYGYDWSKGLNEFSSSSSSNPISTPKILVGRIATSDVSSMTSSYMR